MLEHRCGMTHAKQRKFASNLTTYVVNTVRTWSWSKRCRGACLKPRKAIAIDLDVGAWLFI